MKVQAVLLLQSGALWHLVAFTNPGGFNSTYHLQHVMRGQRVKNSSLSVTSTKSRPSSLQSVFVRGPTSFAVPFGYTSLTMMVLCGCSKSSSLSAVVDYTWALSLDVGRGSKGCHLSAILWMDCLGKISPLRSRMTGCETRRNCLSLCWT